MYFNEYGVVQMVKQRHEEIVKKAQDAWKYEEVKQESFFQKLLRKWNSRQKSNTLTKQNGCCPCYC